MLTNLELLTYYQEQGWKEIEETKMAESLSWRC
jgi:hypothetical protein